jgi:hypothetical protein
MDLYAEVEPGQYHEECEGGKSPIASLIIRLRVRVLFLYAMDAIAKGLGVYGRVAPGTYQYSCGGGWRAPHNVFVSDQVRYMGKSRQGSVSIEEDAC